MTLVTQKCKHRDVGYQSVGNFFTRELVKEANQHWEPTLGILVTRLPHCEQILNEVRQFISEILYQDTL